MNYNVDEVLESFVRQNFMPNEDIYREKCRNSLNQFLNVGFMAIKPFEQDDEQILQDLEQRSKDDFADISNFAAGSQYFCRVLCYDGTENRIYEKDTPQGMISKDYTVFLVRPLKGEHAFAIKRTQLLYGNNLFDGTIEGYFDSPETFGLYVGSLDNNDTNNNDPLPNKFLESYCFNTISRFNSMEVCRRLLNVDGMSNCDLCKLVREEILKAQAFSLFLIINYPTITTEPYYSNNKALTDINHRVWKDEFEKSCKSAFEAKLRDVEAKLNELGLSYEKVRK